MPVKLVPNQKAIEIVKMPCNKNNPYTLINLQAANKAAEELSPNGFRLWFYLAANKDGYEFAFSSQHVIKKFKTSKNAVLRAVKELINKGFLVQKDSNNFYNYFFYEGGVDSFWVQQ